MSNITQNASDEAEFAKPLYTPIKRRSFFMYAGATAGATALLLSGCDDDDNTNVTPASGTVSLGSGDVGVLNYAYALEQLEAAFYAQVKATPAADFSATEKDYFNQVAAHEAIHRDFFKAAINRDAPGKIIPTLGAADLNFGSIDFTKRASVLATAKTFEDLGVAAYNGAGKYLKNPAYLVIAGQIVSVEARHAAYVRDLISNGSFADDSIIDPVTGLDKAMEPVAVIAAAQPFIKVKLDASQVGK
ncbi:Tat (twin-arginine translocation) pathway signal sequence containing protein [Hymenobacter amundsenii]|uniref:Tat (Twin-arginine translocation) pathway signal sequence containing protein n=1 Tax=Hymenobacter amundsenii TaxID=2006685 RepID=A0A246FJB5_9BACT|nr:ferritin-like domain-containing protein [Hymenobacter amundsenii]OWP62657.1 Tat (twin-arginine translocation) pathway signal sequence containing protein [Hymenobacter amundsenii]